MPRSGAGPHPMRGILLFRTWACCFARGLAVLHVGLLFRTWACCPARGLAVLHVGLLFRTWACCPARGPPVPYVGGVARARNSGFTCGIEGRHADKLVCGPGVCRTLAGTERLQERKNGSDNRARDGDSRAAGDGNTRALRRADTTKHAEPNAPVGAKAARSGRVWSPGHNGPACPSTLRLTSCQRAPWRRGSTHTGHAPQPGPPRRGLSRVSRLRAPQRWGGCGVPTT